MLVAAAVAPAPPLLVPELASGAAGELDGLRAAADEALRTALGATPDRVVLVAAGEATRHHPHGVGRLRPYGVAIDVPLGGSATGPDLPPGLAVGAWLLRRSGWAGPREGWTVATDAPPEEAAALGAGLDRSDGRMALLVLADGSACRTEQAPGWLHPDAGPYDAQVVAALAAGDAAGLATLDPARAAAVQARGRAPLQVLAGAVGERRVERAVLRYAEAPYGVGYAVADWLLAAR